VKCPFKCLATCKMKDAHFCIANALKSYFGKIKEGLIFCGQNVHRIKEIVTVKELIATLLSELKQALASAPLKAVPATM
jgi:nitronate monooxygenase